MGIAPWKCHICGREFEPLKGGLCKICNEPTCLTCFGYKKPQKVTSIKDYQDQMCKWCAEFKECCDEKGISWQDAVQESRNIRARIRKVEEKALSMIKNKVPPDDAA